MCAIAPQVMAKDNVIASADWRTVDLGYDEHTADGIVEVGVPELIETAGYHNDTGSGAFHIIDQWRIDGIAYDSAGTAYDFLKITYRLTVNAKGEVAREFYFEQAGCSK